MANQGKFPRPYVDSVPEEGSDKMIVYTNLDHLDIGGRKSTLNNVDQTNPRDLAHVGKTTGGN